MKSKYKNLINHRNKNKKNNFQNNENNEISKEKKQSDLEYEKEKENEWFNKIKKNNFENNDKYYRTGFHYDQKINSATTSKSKTSSKTSKTSRKKSFIPDKNNPAYIYLLEIQKSKKKRNLTARNKKNFFSNYNKNSPWNNPIKNFQNKEIRFNALNKNQYYKIPSSNKWPNILKEYRNNNGINSFLNEFPFDIEKKKEHNSLKNTLYNNLNNLNDNKIIKKKITEWNFNNVLKKSKEDNKKNLFKMNVDNNNQINENDKENDIDIMFNTNQKNFFKFRKDIIEEPEYEEEDSDDLTNTVKMLKIEKEKEELKKKEIEELKKQKNQTNNKNSIKFPEIYKYFNKKV